ELARLDRPHRAADLLDDAAVLVPHRGRSIHRLKPPVRPQVRTAPARERDSDDGIGRLHDLRRLAVLEPDVARAIKDCSSPAFTSTSLTLMAMIIPTGRSPASCK